MVVLNLQFVVSLKLWHVTWADSGITVNAYAPGIVKTPMMYDIAHEVGKNAGKDDEWGMQTFAKRYHFETSFRTRRCSSKQSASLLDLIQNYITGQTIIVDGGMQFH